MKITSQAFTEGAKIPDQYTMYGKNRIPPIHLEGVPERARSLALIVDDPDAPNGTFNHWLLFNMDPKIKDIKEELRAGDGDTRQERFRPLAVRRTKTSFRRTSLSVQGFRIGHSPAAFARDHTGSSRSRNEGTCARQRDFDGQIRALILKFPSVVLGIFSTWLSITSISTGSTLTPSFSSHLMAALISARLPSSSRQTMPISSVTLAWRTLVTTLNFVTQFPDQRLLISWADTSARGAFAAVDPVVFWLVDSAAFGLRHGLIGLSHRLAPGNRWNDADFVPLFQRRILVLQEANVFFVHIDIHEAANFAVFIHQPFLDSGIARLQFGDRFADRAGR